MAQLWKPMDRAYANVAAPLKTLTELFLNSLQSDPVTWS